MELTTSDYRKLLLQIQKVIGQTQQRIMADVSYEKITMSWDIGRIISEYLAKNTGNNYGDKTFDLLEEDLRISKRALYQMRGFHRSYPALPSKDKALTWSHYKALLNIKDGDERQYFEDFATKSKLGYRELQSEIKKANQLEKARAKKEKKHEDAKLKFTKGEIFTYKMVRINASKNMFLDLGFKVFMDTARNAEFEEEFAENDIVKSVKTDLNISLEKSDLITKKLHTYKAFLDKVVDGDTINVTFDLGFNIRHKEIIRLGKINAPEIKTIRGKEAKIELEKLLKDIPYLIIKTNQTDIYGRYVGDVFLPKIAGGEEIYLNQRLLDMGIVERF